MKETVVLALPKEPYLRRWIGPYNFLSPNAFGSEFIYTSVLASEYSAQIHNISFTLISTFTYFLNREVYEHIALYRLSIRTSARLIDRLEEKLAKNAHWRCLQDGTVTNKLFGVQCL